MVRLIGHMEKNCIPWETKSSGVGVFLKCMETENISLDQVVLWKLIPWKIMQSSTTKDGKYEILGVYHGKEVQTNTPFDLLLVLLLFFQKIWITMIL